MLRILLLAAFVLPASAQLPEFYKSVSRVVWVTKDAARTAETWRKFGLSGVEPQGETSLQVEFRGKPAEARLRWSTAWFGSVGVVFMEPLGGRNAFTEFHERHGDGIFALMHEAPSAAAFDAEVERMRGLGVAALQRATDPAPHIFFDTAPRGKYVLGLVHFPGGAPARGGPGRISQFAFAVRDLEPVSKYWELLGWPAIAVTHPDLHDVEYRGKPVRYAQALGWQRHGAVPYEWCPPPASAPSVYQEFIDRRGEGVQHLGIQVDDIDKAIAERGFVVSQAGAWGEKGRKGSGRFAYLDTETHGGVTVELLWSFR
jgi:methylmalonyl-CoA/ethylmalonyl-CoA epimerase